MKLAKKIIIGCLSIALIASLTVGGSLAFLTDTDEVTNVFTVGDLDITLTEPNWDPDNGENLYPGKTMMKDPVVESVVGDSYMRVYMQIIDKNEMMPNPEYVDEATTPDVAKEIANTNKGKIITDTTRLNLIYQTIYNDANFKADIPSGGIDSTKMYSLTEVAAVSGVTNGVNTAKYTEDTSRSKVGNKCYTYNGIFRDGTKDILFTNIVVPTDWNQTQMELLGKYDITLQAQAIQSSGFADAAAAFTALDAEMSK